ncbi:hypothetical protein K2173_021571 [Erythroxylum novogranatense]|uniref:Uncharacterized protein n=1 Tax=Erythroxylum novogranatense TaxID=1862640 RepID=A0AAV8TNR9_9ROSI|nr:hypothetical protein K2173_021571 [Erythroxylum novogranatense]
MYLCSFSNKGDRTNNNQQSTNKVQKSTMNHSPSMKLQNVATSSSDERDNCYYPGCRKDANCNCEICLASINATLDLIPLSSQKSSFTKLSSSRANLECTPLSFDSSVVSTPRSSFCSKLESPVLKSSSRFDFCEKKKEKKKKKREWDSGSRFMRFMLGLSFLVFMGKGFSSGVSRVLRPVFLPEVVRRIGERSWLVQDINGKLRFLQDELKSSGVDMEISNCSHMNSIWEINEDGTILNSRCVLFKSALEEVSIWGWPLQTAGLLRTGLTSRSFTLLSGRVTEWSHGKLGYSTRKANSSWVQEKLSASIVQLNPNTWILEYQRSFMLDDLKIIPTIAEIFKFSMSGLMKRMNQATSFLSVLEYQYGAFKAKRDNIRIPT